MSQPKRIQRQRTKEWRMPEGAIYVGRPSKWGNPFRIGSCLSMQTAEAPFWLNDIDPWQAVKLYEAWIWGRDTRELRMQARTQLYGKDLVCWCSQWQPCHADVLLELANESVKR